MKKLTLNAMSKEKALAYVKTKYSPEEYDIEITTVEMPNPGIKLGNVKIGEKKGTFRVCITRKSTVSETEDFSDLLNFTSLDLPEEKQSEPQPEPEKTEETEILPEPVAEAPVQAEKKPQPQTQPPKQKPKDKSNRKKDTPASEAPKAPATDDWKLDPEKSKEEADKFAEPALDFSDMIDSFDSRIDLAVPEFVPPEISVPAPLQLSETEKTEAPKAEEVPAVAEIVAPIAEPKAEETPAVAETVAPAEAPKAEEVPAVAEIAEPVAEPKAEETPAVPEIAEPAEAPKAEEVPAVPETAEPAEAPKAEETPAVAETVAPVAEPKAEEAPKAEDNIPVALRPPVKRPDMVKKKDKDKKKPNRPADTRSADEKHIDLLSAVRGIKAPEKSATANENTVIPATPRRPAQEAEMPEAPAVQPAEAENKPARPQPDSKPARPPKPPFPPKSEKPRRPVEEESDLSDLVCTGRVEFATPAEMEAALAFLNTLLNNMHLSCNATFATAPQGTEIPEGMVYAKIDVTGEDTSVLIGHHGDTLDSIQYLVNLAGGRATNSHKDYVKIVVDVENYRAKREKILRDLAKSMARKAIEQKKDIVLEPMNPYERRIIHSEISNIPNVSTHSVGTDENRKVIITYEGSDKGRADKNSRSRRNRNRNRRDNTDIADAETVQRVMSEMAAKKANVLGRSERVGSLDDLNHDIGIDLPPLPKDTEDEKDLTETETEIIIETPKTVPENSNRDNGVEPEPVKVSDTDEEVLREY